MMKGVFKGIYAYRRSLGLIAKLNLWRYFIIPVGISISTAIGIGFVAWVLSDTIGGWLAGFWTWDTGATAFAFLTEMISAIILIAVGLILYKHIVMALSAPFMGPVSEKIECYLTQEPNKRPRASFTALLLRGIRINLRNLGRELLITLPILLLNFIPVVGSIIATFLLFITQSYYAGFGNMDYTLERHFDYRQRVDFVRSHKGEAIGNGIIFMAMLFIPIIGIIFVLPIAVTAATAQSVSLIYSPKNQRFKSLT